MKFWTRARGVGVLGIVLTILLMLIVNTNLNRKLSEARDASPDKAPASVWAYDSRLYTPKPGDKPGAPPVFTITLPTLATVLGIGALLFAGGGTLFVRNPDRRGIAPYMSTVIAMSFVVILLWGTAGGAAARGSDLSDTLSRIIRIATPLVLGALAGLVCERSGVVNIGIEGMMLAAACFGYTGALIMGNVANSGGIGPVWFGVVIAVITGGLMAALHALLSIRFKVDQIISGTVINIMAIGLTGYIRSNFIINYESPVRAGLQAAPIPLLWKIPLIGPILFNHKPITYMMLLMVGLMHVLLFHTVWGLRTRAIGEHPKAADTVGINVNAMRFRNVVIGGMIAGLAGAWFGLESTFRFDDLMTNGAGFIALAAMIFGKWTPLGAFGGALLFSSANALQLKVQDNIGLAPQFLQMLPYVVTIIVLAGVIGRARPPAAVGQPYEK
jgi:simple sugar transport system permease protein